MAWLALIAAGVLEIIWAFAMKQSAGFSRPGPAMVTIAALISSLMLLAFAMKSLPLGSAYMIWTGIGAVGAFAVGVLVLGEQAGALRIAAAMLIGAGLVLMKVATPE